MVGSSGWVRYLRETSWGGVAGARRGGGGVGHPDLREVVAVEHSGEEGEGSGAVLEAVKMVVNVGGVDMEAWVGGQVVGVAKKLEMRREVRMMPNEHSIVIGRDGALEGREVERGGI